MPTTGNPNEVCSAGQFKDLKLVTGRDRQLCRQGGGVPVVVPDAGATQNRISGELFTTELSGGLWNDAMPGASLPNAHYGTRLLTFPFCELRRQAPQSPLVQIFDRLDAEFSDETRSIFDRDPELRTRSLRIGLEAAFTLAAAFEQDGKAAEHAPSLSADLVADGRKLSEDVAKVTHNKAYSDEIAKAVDLVHTLVGTPITGLISAIRSLGATSA